MELRVCCRLLQAVGDVLQADGQAAPDQTTEPVTARAMLEEGASGVSQEKKQKVHPRRNLEAQQTDCRLLKEKEEDAAVAMTYCWWGTAMQRQSSAAVMMIMDDDDDGSAARDKASSGAVSLSITPPGRSVDSSHAAGFWHNAASSPPGLPWHCLS
jgi:hypothetical protein